MFILPDITVAVGLAQGSMPPPSSDRPCRLTDIIAINGDRRQRSEATRADRRTCAQKEKGTAEYRWERSRSKGGNAHMMFPVGIVMLV